MEQHKNWRRITENDLPALLEFCQENTDYYTYIKCIPTMESLREQLTILPPGATPEQKQFGGLWEGDTLIAIADLILNWPKDGVVYIGWFMVKKALQRKGIGGRLEEELTGWVKTTNLYHTVRLGCVEDNRAGLAFWQRCGFTLTGERVDTGAYTVLLLEKVLRSL